MLGPSTAGQLQASALSAHAFCQSDGTVPCCIHSVFQLTRSTKQCHVAAIKVNSSAKECEPNAYRSLYNTKQQIILETVPDSNNLLVSTFVSCCSSKGVNAYLQSPRRAPRCPVGGYRGDAKLLHAVDLFENW